MEERWLSADEIAARLGAVRDTAWCWVDQQKLPAHMVDRLRKFKASEANAWVKWGETAPSDPENEDA